MTTQKDYEGLVGTVWRHTRKAVAAGHPGDRLFYVTGATADGLLAWKVTEVGDGLVIHPAYGRGPVQLGDIDPFCGPTNGAQPTALFEPDSFYRLA